MTEREKEKVIEYSNKNGKTCIPNNHTNSQMFIAENHCAILLQDRE